MAATAAVVAAAAADPVAQHRADGSGSTASDPPLEVRKLSLRFGASTILDRLSYTVGKGRVHALVGESGSGKSLSCLALADLQPPNAEVSGDVLIAGEALRRGCPRLLRTVRSAKVRFIFQDSYGTFNPSIRVGSQIEEGFPPGTDRRVRREQTRKLLQSVGLEAPDEIRRAWPFQLSGGMLQRAGIAMALAGKPSVLVCDEPTTALDPLLRVEIVQLLRRLADTTSIAIVFVTHDLRLLSGFADSATVLEAGETRDSGPLDAIMNNPSSAYTRDLLHALPPLPGNAPLD